MSRMTWRDEEALRERLARKEQELEETTAALAAERASRKAAEAQARRFEVGWQEWELHARLEHERRGAAEARAERLASALRGLVDAYEAKRGPSGIVSYAYDPMPEGAWSVATDTLELEASSREIMSAHEERCAEVVGLRERVGELEAALRSIAANGCCDRCQEAALVARAALAAKEERP